MDLPRKENVWRYENMYNNRWSIRKLCFETFSECREKMSQMYRQSQTKMSYTVWNLRSGFQTFHQKRLSIERFCSFKAQSWSEDLLFFFLKLGKNTKKHFLNSLSWRNQVLCAELVDVDPDDEGPTLVVLVKGRQAMWRKICFSPFFQHTVDGRNPAPPCENG